MKREELKPMSDLFLDMGIDVEGNRNYQPWTAYDKDEADSVMDAMEKQIRTLENDKEEMYEANLVLQARIKELEMRNDVLNAEYDLLKSASEEKIKELEAQCIKYQAELMNRDPALNPPTTTEEK